MKSAVSRAFDRARNRSGKYRISCTDREESKRSNMGKTGNTADGSYVGATQRAQICGAYWGSAD